MEVIKESGLSRIWKYTQNDITFAIIGSVDKDTKEDKSKELFDIVSKKGLSRIWLKCYYQYDDDSSSEETYLLLPNINKELALSIAEKLNQKTLIWKDSDFFGIITKDKKSEKMFTEYENNTFSDIDVFGLLLAESMNHNKGKKFTFKLELITLAKKGSSLYRLGDKYNDLVSEVLFECKG